MSNEADIVDLRDGVYFGDYGIRRMATSSQSTLSWRHNLVSGLLEKVNINF